MTVRKYDAFGTQYAKVLMGKYSGLMEEVCEHIRDHGFVWGMPETDLFKYMFDYAPITFEGWQLPLFKVLRWMELFYITLHTGAVLLKEEQDEPSKLFKRGFLNFSSKPEKLAYSLYEFAMGDFISSSAYTFTNDCGYYDPHIFATILESMKPSFGNGKSMLQLGLLGILGGMYVRVSANQLTNLAFQADNLIGAASFHNAECLLTEHEALDKACLALLRLEDGTQGISLSSAMPELTVEGCEDELAMFGDYGSISVPAPLYQALHAAYEHAVSFRLL